MFLFLLVLFTLIPAIEIYLIISIGSQIGAMHTLGIILSTGIIGAYLAKSQGLSILSKIQIELNSGKIPTSQLVHGLLVFAGGLLLLTPGFLTDFIGFCFVLPGTRHIICQFLKHKFTQGVQNGNIYYSTFSGSRYNRNSTQHTQGHQTIIDAEFKEKE
ncbi:MAG: FxsA family protein [Halobacteriovoraceae bacterium]|nr:FxsA family protein [Halobacteriovoraceae bacterium]MCB9095228.1 FxsA family protein [Halobacteriovoraceae bacterium]